jgi:hypothetical protein
VNKIIQRLPTTCIVFNGVNNLIVFRLVVFRVDALGLLGVREVFYKGKLVFGLPVG